VKTGDRFRETLALARGSADALSLFKNFTGRDPYIEPLLKRRGLDRAPGPDDTKADQIDQEARNPGKRTRQD